MRLPPPEPESDGPNLTPVIDVVFLLLIFFLVATKFDQQERLVSINLAEIFKPEPMAVGTKEVIVNITKDGKYFVGNQPLTEVNLADVLHGVAIGNPGKRNVQIRADQEVPFKHPLTVMGLCKQEDLDYRCTVLPKEN
ncbi:MAG: biopolymer transporter ExbD [Pirellulaceae bacterium]|jgi:biopolymer transport protein ExbD